MLSGNVQSVPLSRISLGARQRQNLGDITNLAQSLAADGQLNPIVITPDFVLVAGERRYTAAQQLGWTSILAHFTTDLTPAQAHKLELEENVRRKALDWKEQTFAIHDYHQFAVRENPEWTQAQTAAALGISDGHLTANLAVARALHSNVDLVINADTFSVARGVVERLTERAKASQLNDFDTLLANARPKPTVANATPHTSPRDESAPATQHLPLDDEPADARLLNTTFEEWLESRPANAPRFNFIHCDFPYGINYNKHAGGATDKHGGYADRPEDYFSLLNLFTSTLHQFTTPSAHVMFWFSMDYYHETLTTLSSAGLTVNPFPLVWYKADNSGILPDPRRGPRRNYETAFLCTQGDRPVVQAVSNVAAVANKKEIHASEKPRAMLAHFFRMFVDSTSYVFDPTAGSANALKQAESMGAASVLGLERDPNFYRLALDNWKDET